MSQDIFETSNSMSGNLKKSIDTVNVQGFKIKQLFPLFKTKASEFEFQSKKTRSPQEKFQRKVGFMDQSCIK